MLYMVLIIMENPNNENLPDLIASLLEEGLNTSGQPWSNIFQSAMRNVLSRPTTTPTEPIPSHTESTTPPTAPRSTPIEPNPNNITPLIDNLIYEYSRNMRDYNKNIQDIIQLLRLTQQNIEPVSLFTYTYYPNANTNTNTTNTTVNPLTTDEIAYATRTYSYINDTASNNEESNRCPISLETFHVGDVVCEIRGCGHIFKRPPLMRWFRRNSQCPMCRYQLRDYRQPEPEPRQSEDAIERIVRQLLSQPNNNNNNNPNIDPVD